MNGNMSIQETLSANYQESRHRRSKLEICLELLRVVASGVKKPTRIMYAVNISWTPLVRILKLMVSKGFIRKIEAKDNKQSTYYYEITQSGLKVLNYFDREKEFLKLMESTSNNA